MKFKHVLEENVILYEMARIGKMHNNEYDVWVHTDDPGKIPHMHIGDSATKGENFHACVKFESPEYFMHTGKEDIFNAKMKKEFIKFLKSEHKRGGSNWQHAIENWNDNNSDIELPLDLQMPDYTKL